ncbi:hypothetical protein [Nocardia sp. NPDC050175]|uniref:hypothetical protein n=1 Tax=Nocardia sp. NPDC050175 TaxID=3364317 RepID=UPI0037B99566
MIEFSAALDQGIPGEIAVKLIAGVQRDRHLGGAPLCHIMPISAGRTVDQAVWPRARSRLPHWPFRGAAGRVIVWEHASS